MSTPVNTKISLPIGASILIGEPPQNIDPALYMYLNQLRVQLTEHTRQQFANIQLVATAINSGTMATFTISAGSQLTLVNGIVTSVG